MRHAVLLLTCLCGGFLAGPAAGAVVLFAAHPQGAPAWGHEPWRTDGTTEGTQLVEDVNKRGSARASDFVTYRGRVYFSATFSERRKEQRELWRSDGTARGTRLAVDVRPGDRGSELDAITKFRGRLFFTATTGRHGNELRKSDGTPRGTKVVKNIRPGDASSSPQNLNRAGRFLYFTAVDGHGRELWRTNGTAQGTIRLTSGRGTDWKYSELTNVGGKLFFFAGNDRPLPDELWRSDGTRAGTRFVRDIDHWGDPRDQRESYVWSGLVGVGDVAVFLAQDETHGAELWKSEGTRDSTRRLTATPGDAQPSWIGGTYRGEGFFTEWESANAPHDDDVWATDGTRAGTRLVKDFATPSHMGLRFTRYKDRLYFFVSLGPGEELWSTDGTESGTERAATLEDADVIWDSEMRSIGGLIYFIASAEYDDDRPNFEPWRSDGTDAGTFLLKDINPDPWGSGNSKVDVHDMAVVPR
jgi:ELWxxDGT repeat protein